MKDSLPHYPFDPQRCMGTVCEVTPHSVKVNLPEAATPDGQWLYGNRLGRGEVGEFVVVESGEHAIFGRVINVKLPERERLTVEPGLGKAVAAHPVGTIQLLATVSLKNGKVSGGIANFPRLGCRVYTAHPLLLKWLAEAKARTASEAPVLLDLAFLPTASDTTVNFTPENLFGRHCAVLGATGGGKSWTIARLVEQAARHHSKIILLDATGEFHTLQLPGIRHVYLGPDPSPAADASEVVLPYSKLTEIDLTALFKPSVQTQGPKLRGAMKSLKVVKLAPALATDGCFVKANKKRQPFEDAHKQHVAVVESLSADFDIDKLSRQLDEECVWPSGGTQASPDYTSWGRANDQERGYCVTLISRIEDMLQSKELACVFKPKGKVSLFQELESFLKSPDQNVLRVSLKFLGFAHNAREIVANAIGRHLLNLARDGEFRQKPLFVFLDEAHQFLNKSLGDESTKHHLDAFDLIAKEGRKFCLNICIATQRPRDIPDGVLSQMGTLIVHRLTNAQDREVVEKASGDIDRSAAAFLPTLAPGQAIVIGVDFPIPLTVQISKPDHEPDSEGPDYQGCWSTPLEASTTETTVTVESTPNGAVQSETSPPDDDVPF
jgi:hypothetical protein